VDSPAAIVAKVNHLVIESQARHGIVLAVTSPEFGLVKHRSSGDESIADFDAVASGVFAQKLARQLTDVVVCCNADERTEEARDELVFMGERSSPDFRGIDGRIENNYARDDQSFPFCENGLIPGAQDLDGNVSIEENGHAMPIRFRRVPLRRLRT